MKDKNNIKDEWLSNLADEYDGPIPIQSENDVVQWLKQRVVKTEDKGERKNLQDLIEEAKIFGGSDDWGTISTEVSRYARFQQLLKERIKG